VLPVSVSAFAAEACEVLTSRGGVRRDASTRVRLSTRDQSIVALACQKLANSTVQFGDALRALREATEELIPAGRTYLLGTCHAGPIVGSIISGVGIVPGVDAVLLVHIDRSGGLTPLGTLIP
jgi:hypothetical protein